MLRIGTPPIGSRAPRLRSAGARRSAVAWAAPRRARGASDAVRIASDGRDSPTGGPAHSYAWTAVASVGPAAAAGARRGLLTVSGKPRKEHTKVEADAGGSTVSLEIGKVALFADGSAVARQGGTVVLATVCSDIASAGEADFMPLSVEYREKAFAAGKIPATFLRREGASSEKETLSARLVDRALRPLFPEKYTCDTQIICTALSADGDFDPDVLSLNAASAALVTSDVPWAGPVAAVRVGRVDGAFVANPTHDQLERSDLSLVYAGTRDRTVMIEAGARSVPEDDFVAALRFAHGAVQPLLGAMEDLGRRANIPKRPYGTGEPPSEELWAAAREFAGPLFREVFTTHGSPKATRGEAQWRAGTMATEELRTRFANATPAQIKAVIEGVQEETIRGLVLAEGRRVDGRRLDEVRRLVMEGGVLPVVHGSSLFARGETQTVCVTTLGTPEMAQTIDALTGGPEEKRFMVHYSFPPFATNETGRVGGRAGRREVGHGALAERALLPVLPPEEAFPYVIRVNAEVTMSDGSSSMATVVGGCLALLDAGVPIEAPVAGVSVGLVSGPDPAAPGGTRYQLLTDILGVEDHFGDMDFKMAGSAAGLTGVQLDVKVPGLPPAVVADAVAAGRAARLRILAAMAEAFPERRGLRESAPRVERVPIDPERKGALIGPQGSNIRRIEARTGAEVTLEESAALIFAASQESMEAARRMVLADAGAIDATAVHAARVVEVKEATGAVVELLQYGREAWLHISEVHHTRIPTVGQHLAVGDEIEVKVIGFDNKGRARVSRKVCLPPSSAGDAAAPAPGDGAPARRAAPEDDLGEGTTPVTAEDVKVGATYEGAVHALREEGAVVAIDVGGRTLHALVHWTRASAGYVAAGTFLDAAPALGLAPGAPVRVQCTGLREGRPVLSRKAVLEEEARAAEIQVDGVYEATVAEVRPYGVMVRVPGQRQASLVHMAELAPEGPLTSSGALQRYLKQASIGVGSPLRVKCLRMEGGRPVLSARGAAAPQPPQPEALRPEDVEVGGTYEAEVLRVRETGLEVLLPAAGRRGFVHMSEVVSHGTGSPRAGAFAALAAELGLDRAGARLSVRVTQAGPQGVRLSRRAAVLHDKEKAEGGASAPEQQP